MSNIIIPGKPEPPKLSKTQKLHKKIDVLERELNSAKCLLWAAIRTAGGRVDILKSTMEQLNENNKLESYFEPKDMSTVIMAKVKGEK